jgi:hypothetical protein
MSLATCQKEKERGGGAKVRRRRAKRGKTEKKEEVDWERLKDDAEIRDLLTSNSSEDECENSDEAQLPEGGEGQGQERVREEANNSEQEEMGEEDEVKKRCHGRDGYGQNN